MKDLLVIIVVVAAIVGLLVLVGGRGLLVDEDVAVRALKTAGYTDVTITNRVWIMPSFRGCGEEDAVKFEATAKNPRDQSVSLFVCVGWPLKGATVRTQ